MAAPVPKNPPTVVELVLGVKDLDSAAVELTVALQLSKSRRK
eukprot:SAG11_NODE_36627_length_260_cov_1.602484_1_plen_41_part_10